MSAYAFVFDICADGRTLRCLTVIDEFTRVPSYRCRGRDPVWACHAVLTQLVSMHGAPRYLRSDNGPEFVARVLLRWLQTAQIDTAFIGPDNPGRMAPTNRSMGRS